MGLTLSRAGNAILSHGRSMYDTAFAILAKEDDTGSLSFKPTQYDRMKIQGDEPHPDIFYAWCEEQFDDVANPGEAEDKYFSSWYKIFQYYDPVAKAWLRAVCDNPLLDLQLAWNKARKDYLLSKGIVE